jgi:polysaccharide biosynthesis protein PslH
MKYKIIICGKRLPAYLDELKAYTGKNIIYAGFVDDIENYFKGSDIFLNPVQSGGGVKTKVAEAIGFGTTVISTKTGAEGLHKEVCGNKLILVADSDWKGFAKMILQNAGKHVQTPVEYYEMYYWGNLVKRMIRDVWGRS